MEGQLSNNQFREEFPNAQICFQHGSVLATTFYGEYTTNYWRQHEDGSWTNYYCSTSEISRHTRIRELI